MLRQRTVAREEEDSSEGIFIGDVEEPSRSLKDKISVQSENSCWKYFSLFLTILAVLSVSSNMYQYKQLSTYQHNIEDLQDKYQNYQAESTADRHSVEECKSEMKKMETHMNNRENEKTELDKEISRLKRAIENGGVTKYMEEQKRKEEEERQQVEKQNTQNMDVGRQQGEEIQQEELQRDQEQQQ